MSVNSWGHIMDVNSTLNEAVMDEQFTHSDPSDYTPDEAERIAREELEQSRDSRADEQADAMMLEKPWTITELLNADLQDNYIIQGCLVSGQPGIIAGASKTLKTTLAVFLLLSLVFKRDFLGKFKVNRQQRVFFATAESGKATVQKTILAVAQAMGITDDELLTMDDKLLSINWWVPRASNVLMLDTFTTWVDQAGADVCIIDPLYQTLDDQQSSVILNGQQLAMLSKHIERIGATPVMIDHVKRSSQNAKDFQPLELEDITGAGKAEFFRQWMLLSRRSRFEPSEAGSPLSHELWLSLGGSAGHASTWALDIDELNTQDDKGNLSSRTYSLDIQPRGHVVAEQREKQADRQAIQRARKEAEANEVFQRLVDKLRRTMLDKPNEPFTKSDVRAVLRCAGDKAAEVIYHLEAENEIIKLRDLVKRGNNKCEAWHIAGELVLDPDSTLDTLD